MKPAGLIVFLLATMTLASEPAKPRVARASLAPLESSFDVRITRAGQNDPFDLLGNTRGVYLAGYGVVFTAELNLVVIPITPFRPQITKEDAEKIRRRKLAKLGELKDLMRGMMMASAGAINTLPPDEQVVVAVTLFYFSWENTAGLPSQIVMQAPKSALLKGPGEALTASLRVEEF